MKAIVLILIVVLSLSGCVSASMTGHIRSDQQPQYEAEISIKTDPGGIYDVFTGTFGAGREGAIIK